MEHPSGNENVDASLRVADGARPEATLKSAPSSRRQMILMLVLMILVLGYVGRTMFGPDIIGGVRRALQTPLPGKNAISNLKAVRDQSGTWFAEFDYFYTGEPDFVQLVVDLSRPGIGENPPPESGLSSGYLQPERGAHHLKMKIPRPHAFEGTTTEAVVVRMSGSSRVLLASEKIPQLIVWPDWETWQIDREIAEKSPQEIVDRAVSLIDQENDSSLTDAKHRLERLLAKDAKVAQAYIELARIAMKSNWGPEGLHQAENLILSAQQIEPDSVNAKILLGYVYAHQKRYKSAEELFVDASRSEPRNLWLWANWGQLFLMQGKSEQAVQKYREAIARPRSAATYDRARLDAYRHLLQILEQQRDLDGMEAVHKQRAAEFGGSSCFSSEYARFMLQERGNVEAAMALAREAMDSQCRNPLARQVLGMANYVAWTTSNGAQRDEYMNQARVFFPPGAWTLYMLASSERTLPAVQRLVASGEAIDQHDNENFNAIAYALREKNYAALRRLLKLGAQPTTPVGMRKMPVALLPVVDVDIDAIHIMQQFGVDYTKLRFEGMTALDHAKQTGNRKLLDALDPKMRVL